MENRGLQRESHVNVSECLSGHVLHLINMVYTLSVLYYHPSSHWPIVQRLCRFLRDISMNNGQLAVKIMQSSSDKSKKNV